MLCAFYHNKTYIKRFGKLILITQLFLEVSFKPSLTGQERICCIQQGVNFSLNVGLTFFFFFFWPNLEQSEVNFRDNCEVTTT